MTVPSHKDLKTNPQSQALHNKFIKRFNNKLYPNRNCCSLYNKINKVAWLLMKLNRIDLRFSAHDVG